MKKTGQDVRRGHPDPLLRKGLYPCEEFLKSVIQLSVLGVLRRWLIKNYVVFDEGSPKVILYNLNCWRQTEGMRSGMKH